MWWYAFKIESFAHFAPDMLCAQRTHIIDPKDAMICFLKLMICTKNRVICTFAGANHRPLGENHLPFVAAHRNFTTYCEVFILMSCFSRHIAGIVSRSLDFGCASLELSFGHWIFAVYRWNLISLTWFWHGIDGFLFWFAVFYRISWEFAETCRNFKRHRRIFYRKSGFLPAFCRIFAAQSGHLLALAFHWGGIICSTSQMTCPKIPMICPKHSVIMLFWMQSLTILPQMTRLHGAMTRLF